MVSYHIKYFFDVDGLNWTRLPPKILWVILVYELCFGCILTNVSFCDHSLKRVAFLRRFL